MVSFYAPRQLLAAGFKGKLYGENGYGVTEIDAATGTQKFIAPFPQQFEYGASAALDIANSVMYMFIYESNAALDTEFAKFDLQTNKFVSSVVLDGLPFFGAQFQPR